MTIEAIDGGKIEEYDWEEFFISANGDFSSTLILWYSGSVNNTASWLMMHTIEKYLKSYLVFSKDKTRREAKKIGHDLIKLKEKFDKSNTRSFVDEKLKKELNIFFKKLNNIKDNVRYGEAGIFSSGGELYYFVIFCSYIRYLILGREKY